MSSEAVTGFFGAQCVCRACKPTWPSHPPGPRTLYTVSVAPEGLELRSRSLWSVPRSTMDQVQSTSPRKIIVAVLISRRGFAAPANALRAKEAGDGF